MNRSPIKFAACTIIAKNYLPMARVLVDSWNQFHPNAPFFVLLLDSPDGYFSPADEDFSTVLISELEIPNLQGFLFKYSILEASTAAKPYFMRRLFSNYSIDKLLYLDPDIQIFAQLDPLNTALDTAKILLIPHLTTPMPPDDASPTDHDILQAGTYNLGFLGLRDSDSARSLLDWWCDKLYHQCVIAFDKNLFVDQRWMDLVPGLYDGVTIWRDPTYNIAYWNLHERHVTIQEDLVSLNGQPMRFFHFSGFNPDEPRRISKHQNRFESMASIGDARTLYAKYRQLLIKKGWKEVKNWRYDHNFFANGVPIPPEARRYYWGLGTSVEHLGNPFRWLGDSPVENSTTPPTPTSVSTLPFGVNVLGYLNSEKGVGEMGRSNVRVLHAANIPHVANLIVDRGSHNVEAMPSALADDNPYSVNLIAVNADQLPNIGITRPCYFENRFNIGYWAWELSQFPKDWERAFDYVDEVWTLSQFARDSISANSPVPVHVVHCSLDLDYQPTDRYGREEFGILEDTFLFLFYFDFHSFIERKNPIGLVKAFRHAFGSRRDVQLVIKSSHSGEHLDQLRLLQQAAGDSNVRVLDRVLSRDAKHSLMTAADCYVSLHRSEGFGLTIAEAMMCAKPAIATNYSGNRDFMTAETSFPIPYRLVEIDRDHGPYQTGQQWAQPDLDYATDVMRHIEQNRREAAEVGRRAMAHVTQILHPATIGACLRQRLDQLGLGVCSATDAEALAK